MTHPPSLGRNARQRSISPKRPSSIAELADRAKAVLWDDSKDFKYYLRLAENHRNEGKELAKRGDLEGAFVELARAATLVLEKLPMHKDYHNVLSSSQQHNLSLVCCPSPQIALGYVHFAYVQKERARHS